jgi:GT2 family glycosyltransferase
VTPVLSICLVTYNALAETQECIRSIAKFAPSCAWEILLADNGSTDGTAAQIETEFPHVRLIRGQCNEGFAVPANRCLRAAQGEYLALLNNDTLAMPGLWDSLIACMKINPRAGIVGPKVLNRNGSMQRQCRRSYALPMDLVWYLSGAAKIFPHHPRFARYLMGHLPEDVPALVDAVSGACMLLRREMTAEIGFLDERFFAYQEDTDYCQRAAQGNWEVWYWPAARVIHLGGRGGSQIERKRSIFEWHRSYYRYYQKYFANKNSRWVNGVIYAAMGFKLALAMVPLLFRRSALKAR